MFKNLLFLLLLTTIVSVQMQAQCPTIYVNQDNLPSLPEGLTAGDDLQLCFDLAVDESTFNPDQVEFEYILLVDNTPSTVTLQNVYTSGTAVDPNATGQICFETPVPGIADSCSTYNISLEIVSIFYIDDTCPGSTIAYDLNLPAYGFELQGEDLNELIPLLALAGFNPLDVEILAPGGCAGCTDPAACNYNPNLTLDDGSCADFDCEGECAGPAIPGGNCDDGLSFTANDTYQDDCTCSGELLGCTNMEACNYNPYALVEDNSCLVEGESCDDGNVETVNDLIDSECNCTGVVGISQFGDISVTNIFPSPVSDILNIEIDNSINQSFVTSIYDLTGKLLFTQNNLNTSEIEINIEDFQKGIYILSVGTIENSKQFKIMKN